MIPLNITNTDQHKTRADDTERYSVITTVYQCLFLKILLRQETENINGRCKSYPVAGLLQPRFEMVRDCD